MSNTKTFKEMTKAEKFATISTVEGITEEMREFLAKEIESIRKKNSYKSKADKEKEKGNMLIESKILEVLSDSSSPLATAQIATAISNLLGEYISTQKIVPRCKALVESGSIVATVEKKTTKYRVAE